MRAFFDTEFTDLHEAAALILIGLVDEAGEHAFYAELTDTNRSSECSSFCKREVLPHLQGGGAGRTLEQLRSDLHLWLAARGPRVCLVCDSTRDLRQLEFLFPGGLPGNCSAEVLGFWAQWKRRLANRGHRVHRRHGLRVHHALEDAQVNRIIFARGTCGVTSGAPRGPRGRRGDSAP